MKEARESNEQLAHKLLAYLRTALNEPLLEYAEPLTQLQGGYETYTYRFALRGGQEQMPGRLVLRLYPAFYGAHNALWESTVQRVLAVSSFPVPPVYLTCTDLTILGGAFFIMAFLPGQLLINTAPQMVPMRLGKTHAALHTIDPTPLIEALRGQGVAPEAYRLDRRMEWLRTQAEQMPFIREAVQWLLEQRPPEPDKLAICHGDFHPLNILVDGERISGVLDWPGFMLADPALDVANTLVLTTIPARHVAAAAPAFAGVDWELVGQLYLEAYQAEQPLDTANLPYYRVRRCVHALLEGAKGQSVWQQPAIVGEVTGYIRQVTGLHVRPDS